MSTKRILLAICLFIISAYLYTNVLPFHFSQQNPISSENLTGEYDKTEEKGMFHGQPTLSYYIPEPKSLAQVLGSNDSNKRIEVDLTNQKVYAFEGDKKVYEFLVSTGKWSSTPTGTFRIWVKLRATKMSGGSKALNTYYYLPNVPYVMFFGNNEIPASRGYSLHGTYWHNNFGHPMSHGCVNMRTEDAEKLYYWTNPSLNGKSTMYSSAEDQGTPIVIYGVTPAE